MNIKKNDLSLRIQNKKVANSLKKNVFFLIFTKKNAVLHIVYPLWSKTEKINRNLKTYFTKNLIRGIMKKLTLLFGLLLLSIVEINAQAYQGRQDNYWEVGFQVNAMSYFGDLNPKNQYVSNKIGTTRPGIFIQASRKIGTRLRVRGSLGYGRLAGSDFLASGNYGSFTGEVNLKKIARYGRNLSFRNDIQEFAVSATYDFVKSEGRYYRRKAIVPYALIGIGVFHHNPKAKAPNIAGLEEAGKWVALQPLGTEGQGKAGYDKKYSLIQPAALIGGGFRFRVSDRMDIGIEVGWRVLFTNYLDDVGGNSPDLKDLDSKLARYMTDRSAEPNDAVSGKARNIAEIAPIVGAGVPNYGGQPPYPNIASPDNPQGFTRLGSYGLKGDKRGLGKNDVYITTGFHLNYILVSKRYPRYSGN